MCLVVYLGKMLKIKVCIDLGGADIGMPQQLLDAAQVVTRLEHVSGEGVTKQVRVDASVYALFLAPERDPGLYGTIAQAISLRAEEQGGLVPFHKLSALFVPLL